MYSQPHGGHASPYLPSERRYTFLRIVAATCTWSAWITLIGAVIAAIWTVSSLSQLGGLAGQLPAAPTPQPVDPDLGFPMPGSPGGANPALQMLAVLPFLKGPLVLLTLATGVFAFLIQVAMGQAIYVLLDMEENTRQASTLLAALARRSGAA